MKILAFIIFLLPLIGFGEEGLDDPVTLSTPEEIATLSCPSKRLVGGLVSPLSGQLSLQAKDLVVKGAQDIILVLYTK